MKTNYILVDFENVQPGGITPPSDVPLKVLVFLGEKQSKLPADLAMSLQSLGPNAQYVRISGNGKNALDFHIAFWIGKLSQREPGASFHIVSRDKGFDPLVKHLRANDTFAQRVPAISGIQFLNGAAEKSPEDRLDAIARSLEARGASRPRKRKTLRNTISDMFMKSLTDKELDALVDGLEQKGLVSFNNDVVTYQLQTPRRSRRRRPAKSQR